MANVLLGVTGSVAAIHTPRLYQALRLLGHAVKILATRSATYFFNPVEIEPTPNGERNRDVCLLDEDEWPAPAYRRGDPVLHIELRRWADLLLVAPLDANTLAKFALGLADNALTCTFRAWDRSRPVLLAPAMNTTMWEHPATARHLRQIAEDLGMGDLTPKIAGDFAHDLRNSAGPLWLIGPIEKRLACDDVGMGAMAELADIVMKVNEALAYGNRSNAHEINQRASELNTEAS